MKSINMFCCILVVLQVVITVIRRIYLSYLLLRLACCVILHARDGVTDVQAVLGNIYFYGIGVSRNKKKAHFWYLRAAYREHRGAQLIVGSMYAAGIGVRKDYEEAIRWFRHAAEQNNHKAQEILGYMYTNGIGVQKNDTEAHRWIRLASNDKNEKLRPTSS